MKLYDYYLNPYKSEGVYEITNIIEKEDKIELYFTNNIFYPSGGGQPSDRGFIEINNLKIPIDDARKDDDFIILVVNKEYNKILRKQNKVKIKIDIERRIKLTRAHTSEHVLFKIITNQFPDAKLIKVSFKEDESSIFFESNFFNTKNIKKIENEANHIIKKGLEVKTRIINLEKASEIENLRIKIERIKEKTIRIVEIGDFDISACTGTHVKNTREIPIIFITSINRNGNKIKLKFTNNLEILLKFAQKHRDIITKHNVTNLEEYLSNLKTKNDLLKNNIRWLIKNLEIIKRTIRKNGSEIILITESKKQIKEFETLLLNIFNNVILLQPIDNKRTKISFKIQKGNTKIIGLLKEEIEDITNTKRKNKNLELVAYSIINKHIDKIKKEIVKKATKEKVSLSKIAL